MHWVLFIMASSAVALSFLLRAPGGDPVLLPFLDQPLPGMCTFKRFAGVGCPGCGLTRCFVSLAHGDVRSAWAFNPAGILLFAAAVFQIPYRLAQISRIRRGLPELRWRALDWALWLILFALLAQWVVRTVDPTWL